MKLLNLLSVSIMVAIALIMGSCNNTPNDGQNANSIEVDSTHLADSDTLIRSAISNMVVGKITNGEYQIFNLDTTIGKVSVAGQVYNQFSNFEISGNNANALYLMYRGYSNDSATGERSIIIGEAVIIDGYNPAMLACGKEVHTCSSTGSIEDPLSCNCCSFSRNSDGCINGCTCSCKTGNCAHSVSSGYLSGTYDLHPFVINQNL